MRTIFVTAACLAATAPFTASAQNDGNFAISAGAGTSGGTLEAQVRLNDIFVLSGGLNTLKIDQDETVDDIDYTGELDFSGANAFLQVHPFRSSFMLLGGAYVGTKEVSLDATPATPVQIGNVTFTPAQVGSLNGDVSFSEAAPFAGLGFDNTFTKPRGFGFKVYAGAAFFGDSEVALQSTGGTLSSNPLFQAELARERTEIENEIDGYDVYPVVQIALTYRL